MFFRCIMSYLEFSFVFSSFFHQNLLRYSIIIKNAISTYVFGHLLSLAIAAATFFFLSTSLEFSLRNDCVKRHLPVASLYPFD